MLPSALSLKALARHVIAPARDADSRHRPLATRTTFVLAASCLLAATAATSQRPRARDLGFPFDGDPGPLNAITDVAGVEVGHTTLIEGEGALEIGKGPVRTGVTVIFPNGKDATAGVAAGYHSLNGVGELTGMILTEEIGGFIGPMAITNTVSIGTVRDGLLSWHRDRIGNADALFPFSIPVVGETYDGALNDIWGMHVTQEHVHQALEAAASGPVAEGAVGGGTGMICYSLKGGIGTASRVLSDDAGGFTVGVLVQANHGSLDQLLIGGIPVGRDLQDLRPTRIPYPDGDGSIIIVVGTDAPLLPSQLKRIARRASHGLARTGSHSGDGSGDIFLAFSTANSVGLGGGVETWRGHSFGSFDPLFEATMQATEEAIINALVAGETMVGANNLQIHGLPHERVREILRRHDRLEE
jgi:L-aminopeptidase/D-esterase-like protein